MNCEICRDALSAQLDAEDPGVDLTQVHAHLDLCPGCRAFAAELEEMHRVIRLHPAEPIPDLTAQVLARVATPRRFRPEWARYGLFTVAMTQLLIALPALILGSDPGASVHVARELGSWDIALSIGMLYAAWRPERAAGLLPFALALAATMVVTATLDVTTGHTSLLGEAVHLFALVGLVLLMVLASSNWWSVRRPTPGPAL
ncbi:MAG: zf-HC2 domain-containing protein [Microthrixaceae bacterium]